MTFNLHEQDVRSEGFEMGLLAGKREGMLEGERKGMLAGKREGMLAGKREGVLAGKLETARKLIHFLDDETIALTTGLFVEQIQALRQGNSI